MHCICSLDPQKKLFNASQQLAFLAAFCKANSVVKHVNIGRNNISLKALKCEIIHVAMT